MDFEEVIWKQGRDTSKQGNWLRAPRQGIQKHPERGQSLLQPDCNAASGVQESWAQRKEDPRPPRPLAAAVCVCMCHRLTEMTNWVVRERPEQLESLCEKPRGRAAVRCYQHGLLKEQPNHLLLAGGEGLQLDR